LKGQHNQKIKNIEQDIIKAKNQLRKMQAV
jgi:hypothetical protein